MWAHPMQECPRPPWPPEWMLIFSVCKRAQYCHILCSAKVKMKRELTWWSVVIVVCLCVVLQCLDTVVWVSGRAGWRAKIEWCGVGVVICLECGADCLHMVQLMPPPSQNPIIFASFKSRPVLPFWYRLTQVVLEKRPLNRCWVMRCCCGYLSGVRCRLFAYGPADATAIVKPHHLFDSFKSRPVLPFWYWLTQVVLEKRPLNRCSVVW